MKRKPVAKLTIHDEVGRGTCNAAELECACQHLNRQFSNSTVELPSSAGKRSRLLGRNRIEAVKRVIGKCDRCLASRRHTGRFLEMRGCRLADTMVRPELDTTHRNNLFDMLKNFLESELQIIHLLLAATLIEPSL